MLFNFCLVLFLLFSLFFFCCADAFIAVFCKLHPLWGNDQSIQFMKFPALFDGVLLGSNGVFWDLFGFFDAFNKSAYRCFYTVFVYLYIVLLIYAFLHFFWSISV